MPQRPCNQPVQVVLKSTHCTTKLFGIAEKHAAAGAFHNLGKWSEPSCENGNGLPEGFDQDDAESLKANRGND